MLAQWWFWIAGGLALGIVELVLPAFVFAGFAVGGVLTGLYMGLGLPGSAWMMAAPVNALVVFAVLSLLAWIVLRRVVGVRRGQSVVIRRDIND